MKNNSVLHGQELITLAEKGMISPFCYEKRTCLSSGVKAMSYGLGHFGYDIRLSERSIKVCRSNTRRVINPKQIAETDYTNPHMILDSDGQSVILPPSTYMLGMSVETFRMPNNVIGIGFGKSTYARSGVFVNITPLEPGWEGVLTISIFNTSESPVRVYTNEGIAQIVFFRGRVANTVYEGKYQGQTKTTYSRM